MKNINVTTDKAWEGDGLYTLKVINNDTGLEELAFPSVKGGLFIVSATKDNPLATDQGVFGNVAAIALSLFKLPAVMRDIIKHQAEINDVLSGLEIASGEKWELRRKQ